MLRNAGVTGFKAALNPPAGLGVAQQQVLSAFHRVAGPGLACVAWLYGRAGAGTRTPCTPVSASLPCAHPSSLPAPPSASGRPGQGVGRHFLHGGLQIESKNDTGAFGSPVAKDKAANEFREDTKIFRIVLSL